MSRKDLINAMASGDLAKIKELKEMEIQRCKGGIIFAEENQDHTWNPLIPCFGRPENGWKDIKKYKNISAEEFAALIVKYDFHVMETSHGVYINTPFPDDIPDPTMTDEKKHREILDYLKELSTRIPEIGYSDARQLNNTNSKP